MRSPLKLLLFSFASCFLITRSVCALDTSKLISQYSHTAWRIEDGVFQGAPNAIAQTTDGYLWIGTQAGLMRFDGVRFVSWRPPEGVQLPSPRVNALLGARDGSLWIGTATGLARWRNGELTRYPDAAGAIMAIVEDRGGTIWIGRANSPDTRGPLCEVADAAVQCYGKEEGIGVPGAVTVAIDDANGDLWLGGSLLVSRWSARSSKGETFRSPLQDSTAPFNGVSAIAVSPDGSVWAGQLLGGRGGGLQRLVNGGWEPFAAQEFDPSILGVTTLLVDRDRAVWIGTATGGVYRIRERTVDHFQGSDGLSGDAVTNVFQDREGNVWIATSRGIDSFRDTKVISFSTRQGLSTDAVISVLASRDGTVWLGNQNLDVLRSGHVSSVASRRDGAHDEGWRPQGSDLPGRQVTSLFEDSAGRLWVGVDRELAVYERGRFRTIATPDGAALGAVVAMAEDTDANIWAQTWFENDHRLLRINDFRIREEVSVPSDAHATSIVADPSGGIWLGLSSGGLARYLNGKMESISLGRTAPGAPVHGVLVNADGSVWAATTSGLVRWKNGESRSLTVRNGLPCEVIYALLADRTATLWLYAACGLVAIPDAELQRWWESPDTTISVTLLDVFDGALPMSTPFRPNASRSPDGRLWFVNQNILQMVDPSRLRRNSTPPPVHIEDLIADHKQLAPLDGLRLPSLTRDLEIDYTALSFVAPQKVRFRYRLEGHDSDWQDPGTRRQAFYTNLRPGSYRFRVIASNNDGVWNEAGATLAFTLAAAWYQTWWFRGISLTAFVALLSALYQLRVRQL